MEVMEKRSVLLSGHATSVALEKDFWRVLEHVATRRGMTMAALIGTIDRQRDTANLTSALRCFALAEALTGRGS